MKEISFEEALKRLEHIAEDLESEEISLDSSLKKYEEGVKLIKICHKKLEEVKKKVDLLVKKEGSKLKLEDFDESEIDEELLSDKD